MTLVFDRRSDLDNQPGTHALVVGVSSYPYLRGGIGLPTRDDLGFGQLTSAAISAFRFSEWLSDRANRLFAPLATCRLLVAPSASESSAESRLTNVSGPCTLEHFLRAATEWHHDANSHSANMTLLYLAGHGITHSGGQLYLLQDFGDGIGPILRNAIGVNSIFNGMMPSSRNRNIARTQLCFLDTSHGGSPYRLKEFELINAATVFDSELTAVDDRIMVTFTSTGPIRPTRAPDGKATLFNQALLDCLSGAAGQLVDGDNDQLWAVTVNSLTSGLARRLNQLRDNGGVEEKIVVSGTIREAIIHYLDDAPLVDVTIAIDPPEASALAEIGITNAGSELRRPRSSSTPWTLQIPAGLYFIGVHFVAHQFKDQQRIVTVTPPSSRFVIRVAE